MLLVLLVVELIIIVLLLIAVYQKSTNAVCLSRKRLDGKTVIVTGGTAGMGLVIATDLAQRGAKVIIASPFEKEGIDARNQIIQETENEKVTFKHLDLGSFTSTRKFAADILKTENRLDILVNNAAVGFPGDLHTKDGFCLIMQVNYYSTFLLTLLLLPLLKKTGKPGDSARILVTASVAHTFGKVDIENANRTNYWYSLQLYANSKIYLVYFANELAEKLRDSNVVINCVDPGAVGTRIFDSINKKIGWLITLVCMTLFKTPWYGAQTALHVALDKKAGLANGCYFKNCRVSSAVKRAYCDKTTKAVWDESVKIVKLTEDELEHCVNS